MELKSGEKTIPLNKFILKNGLNEIISKYFPSWFYFNSAFGTIYGHVQASTHCPEKIMPYQREYITCPENGKIVLDLRPKTESTPTENEKVLIMLHGVTGSSGDRYMQDLSG